LIEVERRSLRLEKERWGSAEEALRLAGS